MFYSFLGFGAVFIEELSILSFASLSVPARFSIL